MVKTIQFLSPYSIQECTQRVNSLDWGKPPIAAASVTVRHVDDHRYEFTISRWAFLNLVAGVKGVLQYQNERVTNVYLRGSVSLYLRLGIFLYTVLAILISLLTFSRQRDDMTDITWVAYGFFALWGMLIWFYVSAFRNHLLRRTKKVLS